MVNSFEEVVVFATPALASAAVAGAAWWTERARAAIRAGGAAAISVARAAIRQGTPVALAALISGTVGALAYFGRALDVSGGRALHGAALAVLASALALALYWVLGVVVRRPVTLGGLWAVSLVPLYFYALVAWVVVAGYTQCGPQASDCPL